MYIIVPTTTPPVKPDFYIIEKFRVELITTPLSPPSQGGNRKDVISAPPLSPLLRKEGRKGRPSIDYLPYKLWTRKPPVCVRGRTGRHK
ncbi:MAG: hypothetical protein NUV74_18155 [Candidatus Brocadiaceae bacterium]|nr:hypothetical protein [Candidatus Brocadiaceae bacterium]